MLEELRQQVRIIQGDEKARVRIWEFPEHYQVVIRLLQDIPVTAKLKMVSPQLPQPHDQHECSIRYSPGDEDFKVIPAGRWR